MRIPLLARRDVAAWASAALALSAAVALAACSDSSGLGERDYELAFDFSNGFQGWVAAFADYPLGKEAEWAIGSSLATLPAPLLTSQTAVLLTGTNHSDDLFMYLTRPIAGLEPNATYALRFRVELATNAPKGCAGIGGAPGESVVLKVGATSLEPARALDDQQHWRTNFDHGNQLRSGRDAAPIGDIATENANCSVPRYERKQFDSGSMPLLFTADAQGRLWLILGIDSGFEGTTSAYVTSVRVDMDET